MCAGHFDIRLALETSNGTSTFGLLGQRDICGHGKLWDVRLPNGGTAPAERADTAAY